MSIYQNATNCWCNFYNCQARYAVSRLGRAGQLSKQYANSMELQVSVEVSAS